MTDIGRKSILGKPVDGKRADDGHRCQLCGAWVEYRDLGKVLAHKGPLPRGVRGISDIATAGKGQSRSHISNGPAGAWRHSAGPREPTPVVETGTTAYIRNGWFARMFLRWTAARCSAKRRPPGGQSG